MKKANKLRKITKKLGRPSVLTPTALRKLKQAFVEGATDEIACQHAKISPTAFYNNMQLNPDFRDEIYSWKHIIRHESIQKIRRNIKDKDNKDTTEARWWLEKKYPAEFSLSPQSLVQVNANTTNNYIEFSETGEDGDVVN